MCYTIAPLMGNFFTITSNQPLISAIRVLSSDRARSYYMLFAQLVLQPWLVSHTEHTMLHYMLNAQLFIYLSTNLTKNNHL